jgi:hypothetical protein
VAHLSTCIGLVLTNPGLRARLARTARAHVVAGFTLERQADRQMRLLDELLGGGDSCGRRPRSAARQGSTA